MPDELDAIRGRLAPPPEPTSEERALCAAGECGGCMVCWGPPIPLLGASTVRNLLAHVDRLRDLAAALEAELAEATEHLAGKKP